MGEPSHVKERDQRALRNVVNFSGSRPLEQSIT
jgi:hypothetical protein